MDDAFLVYPLIFFILCIILVSIIKIKNKIINANNEPETIIIEYLPKYELEETLPPVYNTIEV